MLHCNQSPLSKACHKKRWKISIRALHPLLLYGNAAEVTTAFSELQTYRDITTSFIVEYYKFYAVKHCIV